MATSWLNVSTTSAGALGSAAPAAGSLATSPAWAAPGPAVTTSRTSASAGVRTRHRRCRCRRNRVSPADIRVGTRRAARPFQQERRGSLAGSVDMTAWALGAVPAGILVVDLDSMICEAHGYQKEDAETGARRTPQLRVASSSPVKITGAPRVVTRRGRRAAGGRSRRRPAVWPRCRIAPRVRRARTRRSRQCSRRRLTGSGSATPRCG